MKKFKVGDKVILRRSILDWPGGFIGSMQRAVNSHKGKTFTVRAAYYNNNVPLICLIEYPCREWNWPPESFDPVVVPIDIKKRVRLRGTRTKVKMQLHSVKKAKDRKRPYRADVTIGKRRLTLSYLPSGHFYEFVDQPIDLVNR